MKVTLIPSSMTASGLDQHQYTTTYLINDTLAVDAGSIGFYRSPVEQAEIQDVLISHTHADHVASLPIFIENAFDGRPNPVTIHGSRVVLDSLQNDIFNGRIWPDFIGMSATTGPVFLRINEIESGKMIELQGLKITPVSVDHLVPTLGFVVDDGIKLHRHRLRYRADRGDLEGRPRHHQTPRRFPRSRLPQRDDRPGEDLQASDARHVR